MKIGDTLTVAGIEWTVRPFSAAEHQAYARLAEAADLDKLAARTQSALAVGGGSTREKILAAEAARLQTRLDAYLEDGAPRDDLTEDDRLKAYELAATIDDLAERREAIRRDREAEALIAQERHLQALDGVVLEFMHGVLASDATVPPLPEFITACDDQALTALQEVVVLGKLPTGLSASTRQQNAMYDKVLKLAALDSGNASASSQPPQE